jgi:hypothetical protein
MTAVAARGAVEDRFGSRAAFAATLESQPVFLT